MAHLFPRRGVVVAVGALLLWGCGGGSSSPTAPSAPAAAAPTGATVTVSIVSSTGISAFAPNPVSANTGDTVVFRNNDSVVHRLIMDDGSDLGDVAPGATSRGFAIRNSSATSFHCSLHPSMVGSINGAVPESECVPDVYGYGCN